jgi:hypothetical protein
MTVLVIAVVSLIAIVYYNAIVAALFAILGAAGGIVTHRRLRFGSGVELDAMLRRPERG